MINAASEGALVDKTPNQVMQLISNIATNPQQFGTRYDASPIKHVLEITIPIASYNP